MTSHEFYMDLALKNAQAMKGQTDPNPLVGAVIVNDNRIVGVGAHMKAGEPHAEIHALRMAGNKARGATIYVTLEPCSHHGRTGPCAEALVAAGVRKVVIATLDPNPIVAGNGVKILQEAGIEVEIGVRAEESRKMNEVFNKYIVEKQPFVTLKAATTLDGKIATYTAHSKWITSELAREDVHQLRNENQAILVGINTVLKDNPQLTTRIPNGRNPIRIILDSKLSIPLDAHVVTDEQAETWIFTSNEFDREKEKVLNSRGIKIFSTTSQTTVNTQEVITILGENQISSLLIEAGGTVNASFFENQLIDKVVVYFAPKLIGGANAPTFLEGTGLEQMSEAIELADGSFTPIGKDFKFVGYPIYKNG
ncbi:bifunctional diaminohydroxyphosphoribosylaminopyrimidine deaminase/5-amino-6-(5-phosphoribosylamino)uracil reductase RibD [Caldibacillus lycopersici]|uniref:Riboflavin biosynthesis protein RibD n=1 Tax=Perspicuibacillus lycopersici TaxID=1325689 RepID=A0AAE3IR85_9BACI|nr:bifunctional diaminohydroxyphosphoribosylaminopyrimidine deaminase/5-amino-6-(5-phosphoribosylamino)uracil reductase RibD [Perspicuibacillus lycopersici]MCU9612961.1 bifunctional diaminohydroxyphosphoribosylaminopyrimidine deaminase/5-amino-6-(5-phosphoribosylamino)uracil reductase RibD [Perspicuibacillus lycopersici]